MQLLGQGLGAIHTALDGMVNAGPAPVRWDADALFGAESPGLMGTDYAALDRVLSPSSEPTSRWARSDSPDHRTAKSTATLITSSSRRIRWCPRPSVVINSAAGQAAARSTPSAYGLSLS